MSAPGRPSKLTTETQTVIVEATSRGCYAHVVARAAGISPSTFHAWMKAGEDEERRIEQGEAPDPAAAALLEFSEAVNRARAVARGYAESRVWETNPEAWLMKGPGRDKPHAEGWASAVKHEHTGADGGPMEVITRASRDLDRRLADIAARRAADTGTPEPSAD